MSSTSISLGTPYRWLGEALALCRAHARVLAGATALLLVVALLPSLVQLLLERYLPPSESVRQVIQALFLLLSLLFFPPVVGGFYRLVHTLREGRPATPLDLFAVFQDAPLAIRLIIGNLVFVLISLVAIAGLAYAFGGQALFEFLRTVSTLKPGATELPRLPDGLLALISVLLVVALVIATAQGLATVHIAVGGHAPLAAVGAGFKATFRNLGAYLLFFLPVAMIAFIVAMVLILVAALLATVLAVVSPTLSLLVLVPIGLLAVLVLYAVMFSFFYLAWRETLGPGPDAPSLHQLAA